MELEDVSTSRNSLAGASLVLVGLLLLTFLVLGARLTLDVPVFPILFAPFTAVADDRKRRSETQRITRPNEAS